MEKILAVVRASSVQQEIESQRVEMENFCIEKGFTEIEWISVKGASARQANDEYLLMLENIKTTIMEKQIKFVAFWSLDRLGRKETYLMAMKDWFVANKVQVFVKNPSLTLLNQNWELNAGDSIAWSTFASIVAYESDELMKKMQRTKKLNAKKNKFNGGADVKVGYVKDSEGYVVVDEEDAGYKLVQLIFNEYATGNYSTVSLTNELKSRGITKPNGKPLADAYIKKILTDVSYIGEKGKEVKTDRLYTPIISKELFNKVSEIRKKNKKGEITKQTKHTFFAVKLLKCPECGANMVANDNAYRCYKAFSKGREFECSHTKTVRIQILDSILWRIAEMEHMEYLIELKNTNIQDIDEKISILEQKKSEQVRLYENIPAQKMKVQEGYENGVYTKTDYLKRLAVISESVNKINKTILELDEQIKDNKNLIKMASESVDYVDKMVDAFQTVNNINSECELSEIIHKFIKRVDFKSLVIDKNKAQVFNIEMKNHDYIWNVVYFPFIKKGQRLFHIHEDGKVAPLGVSEIIRDNKKEMLPTGIDKEYEFTFKTIRILDEYVKTNMDKIKKVAK